MGSLLLEEVKVGHIDVDLVSILYLFLVLISVANICYLDSGFAAIPV
jgi:hypothetical protein